MLETTVVGIAVGNAVTKTFPLLSNDERMEIVGQYMAGDDDATKLKIGNDQFSAMENNITAAMQDIANQVISEVMINGATLQ
jgi:hypothetical protein